jgi:outer membrane biosynthesis protein TonB
VPLGLLLVLVLLLAGCGGEPTSAPTELPPTEVAVQPTTAPTEAPPTEAPTEPPPTEAPTEPPPTETPTEPPPTATPTEEPTPEPVDDTACVGCHTDEETLKAVAEEPEETEALSEGEG